MKLSWRHPKRIVESRASRDVHVSAPESSTGPALVLLPSK